MAKRGAIILTRLSVVGLGVVRSSSVKSGLARGYFFDAARYSLVKSGLAESGKE